MTVERKSSESFWQGLFIGYFWDYIMILTWTACVLFYVLDFDWQKEGIFKTHAYNRSIASNRLSVWQYHLAFKVDANPYAIGQNIVINPELLFILAYYPKLSKFQASKTRYSAPWSLDNILVARALTHALIFEFRWDQLDCTNWVSELNLSSKTSITLRIQTVYKNSEFLVKKPMAHQ